MLQALIQEWISPQGFIVLGMAYGIVQAHFAAARAKANAAKIAQLENNTNSIQEKLNIANLNLGHAQGKAEGLAEGSAKQTEP